MKVILIKYGELTTKGDNRKYFINVLYNNIKKALEGYNVNIGKNRVRMFIETDDDVMEIVNILKNIFGIHSIVIATRVNTNISEIEDNVLEVARENDFRTFKVETDRADKSFPIQSMDFSRRIGALILKNISNISVDVHNPDYLLKIEIREDYTYIYHKEVSGPGGYPVGVAGRGLLMLSGGIDSPVAGYLAMKRGIKVDCVYFESPPHTSEMAKNKVKRLVEKLTKYNPDITLYVIKFTDIQEAIYKNIVPTYMITIMRRMMYRIATKIMENNSYLCLINGESVGQVASQTLTSMNVINNVTNIDIFINIIASAIIGPIFEEILFRYSLINKLEIYFSRKWSIWLSTIIFALCHTGIYTMIFAFIIGIVNGYLYSTKRDILIPIFVHISANMIATFLFGYNSVILILGFLLIIISYFIIKE